MKIQLHSKFAKAAFCLTTSLFFMGCEQKGEPRKTSNNSSDTDNHDKSSKKTLDNRFRLELDPFSYDAYPETSFSGLGYALEYGYVDMRELQGSGSSEPFDYRWHRMGARTGNAVLKTPYKLGCDFQSSTTLASDKKSNNLKISGAVAASAELRDDYFKYSEKSDFKSDYAQPLDVIFTADQEVAAEFEAAQLPTQGSIQIVGEYTGTISSGMVLEELNNAIKVATEDFKLGDIGTGSDYNLVIVDFYGSESSEKKHLRCYLDVEDTATIPIAQFKSIAPIKLAIGMFANLKQEAGYWSAAIIGSGAEDVSLK